MVAARRIGMITPSSNTMVEPLTSAMTAHLLDDLSVHYARIPVTRIALDQGALDQFEREAMLTTPPTKRPNSALLLLVCTRNSATASGLGVSTTMLP